MMIPVLRLEPIAMDQVIEGIEPTEETVRNADLPGVVLQFLPALDDL